MSNKQYAAIIERLDRIVALLERQTAPIELQPTMRIDTTSTRHDFNKAVQEALNDACRRAEVLARQRTSELTQ